MCNHEDYRESYDEDRTITLEDAVRMAPWTHNTKNANKNGHTPFTLAVGKSVIFLGISGGNVVIESLNDDESVWKIFIRIHLYRTSILLKISQRNWKGQQMIERKVIRIWY